MAILRVRPLRLRANWWGPLPEDSTLQSTVAQLGLRHSYPQGYVWQATTVLDATRHFDDSDNSTLIADFDVHLHEAEAGSRGRGPHWVATLKNRDGKLGRVPADWDTLEAFELALARFWRLNPPREETEMVTRVQVEAEFSEEEWAETYQRFTGPDVLTLGGNRLGPAYHAWNATAPVRFGPYSFASGVYSPERRVLFFEVEAIERLPTDGRIFAAMLDRAERYIREVTPRRKNDR